MKRSLQLLAAVLLLASGTDAVAQEARPTLGFGLATSMRSSAVRQSPTVLIFVPIGLGKLRIEPQVGFVRGSVALPGASTNVRTTLLVGAGALWELARTPRTSVYAGGRFGLVYTKDARGSASEDGFGEGAALALGGEYFPAPFVSLGAEAQVGVEAAQWEHAGSDVTAETEGLLFVRFYFR